MSYTVFSVSPEDADAADSLYEDDLVGRQSITVRDASALDQDEDLRYILVEGSEEALDKAAEILGDTAETLDDDRAAEVFDLIKEGEQAGAEGMGMIFGD